MNEIKCINKEDRNNPYERITHIWWVNSKWKYRKITQQEAVKYIDSWDYKFFVNIWWNKVNVITEESRFGNRYIKTESDDKEPNNLLSLPECKE